MTTSVLSMEELVGKVIGPGSGRYRLLAVIASGGMATVFQAEQLNVPRQVAVKVADPAMAQDPTFVRRFRQEVGALAQLDNEPHILPVYDVGEEDGLLYMVMRLITGGTLKERLEKRRGQPWPPREVLAVSRQVLAALAYAHQQGFVHRDVKPSNILLDGDRAYLADFGIAKAFQDSSGGAMPIGPTLTGAALVGTPTYMAPEQALGRPIDARADIYAFGVVLYEMLTGRVPYQADTPMEVAFKHVEAALPPPREVHPGLSPVIEAVLLQALARQPEQRYASAPALAEALEQAVEEAEAPGRHPAAYRPGGAALAARPGGTALSEDDQHFLGFEQELLRRLERAKSEQTTRERQLRNTTQSAPGQAAQVLPETAAPQVPEQEDRGPAALRLAAFNQAAAVQAARERQAREDAERERQAQRERAAREAQVRRSPEMAEVTAIAQPEVTAVDLQALPAIPATTGAAPKKGISRRVLMIAAAPVAAVALAPLAIRALSRPTTSPSTGPGYPAATAAAARPATTSPWSRLGAARVSHTATVLNDGRLLIAGGQGSDGSYLASAEVFDPAANGWGAAAQMARTRAGHTATLLSDGQVLVAGGQDSDKSYLASAELYDPAANRWTSVEPLSTRRAEFTATLLPDGRVLVAGGHNDSEYHLTTDVYDPKQRSWRPAGNLGGVRTDHAAALLPNGRVLVMGGTDSKAALATAEVFDPASNKWSDVGSLGQAREGLTATAVSKDGPVVVAGGFYSAPRDGRIGYVTSGAAERYDPGTQNWGSAGSLAQGRTAHAAGLLANGKLLVVGGQTADGNYLATAEVYDPGTNAWTAAGQLSRARGGHTVAVLRDGTVLVVGGQDATEKLAGVERYDPKANTWTASS